MVGGEKVEIWMASLDKTNENSPRQELRQMLLSCLVHIELVAS